MIAVLAGVNCNLNFIFIHISFMAEDIRRISHIYCLSVVLLRPVLFRSFSTNLIIDFFKA